MFTLVKPDVDDVDAANDRSLPNLSECGCLFSSSCAACCFTRRSWGSLGPQRDLSAFTEVTNARTLRVVESSMSAFAKIEKDIADIILACETTV